MSRLTDAQMRAAAAGRPGYATYPEYRPGQRERLGRLRGAGYPSTSTISAATAPTVPAGPARVLSRGVMIDARPPAPAASPPADSLASLPEARVFEFEPSRIRIRPWWRRRWHWAIIAARGGIEFGYAWTQTGARRLTARAARRAAR